MKPFRRLQKKFYAGPSDLGMTVPQVGRYKSPTLCLFYWAYALVQRHLTMPARAIALSCFILVPYGLVTLQIPIFLLSFFVVALFIGDFIAGMLVWPRLSVTRHTPVRIQENTVMTAVYDLHNISRCRRWDVVIDTLPFRGPFHFSEGRPMAKVVPGKEKIRAKAEINVGGRGQYLLPSVRADSGFPFSLWKWGTTNGSPDRLLVYPAYTPLRQLKLPEGMRYQAGGIAYSSHVGESTEFVGCRYFRDGDNPRHIHWRSWARTGYPVVKEFREEYLPRTALILDTYLPFRNSWDKLPHWFTGQGQSPREFEAALSLTAAVTEYLTDRDFILDFFATDENVYYLQSGRSLAQHDNVLDILSCLHVSRTDALEKVTSEIEAGADQLSGLFVILLSWDEQRRRFLERLARQNTSVRLLYFGEQPIPVDDVPFQVTAVSAENVLSGGRLTL